MLLQCIQYMCIRNTDVLTFKPYKFFHNIYLYTQLTKIAL